MWIKFTKIIYNIILNMKCSFFEIPNIRMMYQLKPLFIRVKVDGMAVNKVFIDDDTTVNLMSHLLFKKMGKIEEDLRPHNMVLSNYEG